MLELESDEQLAARVAAGSEEAFAQLVSRYHDELLAYCRRVMPPAAGEPALRQALVEARRALRSDRRPIRVRPWLFGVAVAACRRERRRALLAQGDA